MSDSAVQGKNRIYSLDVLRIIAILGIVIYHYEQVFSACPAGVPDLCFGGFNGSLIVEFFFLLSGFLAFHDIRKLEQDDISFGSYFKKKYLRLVPVILLPCLSYTLICYIFRSLLGNGGWIFDTAVDIPATVSAMLGIQFWGVIPGNYINYPLWYVDVLLFCYILLGITVKLFKRLNIEPVYAFAAIVLLGMALRSNGVMIPFFNMHLARGYYAFFFGVIIGYLYFSDMDRKMDSLATMVVCLAVFVAGMALSISKSDWFGDNTCFFYTFVTYPALLIAFLNSRIRKVLDFKWIGTIGKVTYDIYAWHLVVYFMMALLSGLGIYKLSLDSGISMIVCVLLSVVVGTLSYLFIDKFVAFILRKIKALFI